MRTPLERAAAIVLTRTMLGFVYFFAGAQRLAAGTDAFGYLTSGVEVAAGGLLLLGLWSRPVLRCLAVLIVGVTIYYGVHGLQNPIGATAMNVMIVNFYILPRAALIIVNLFLPAEDDLLSLDAALDGRWRRLIRTDSASSQSV
jgi:hypothetical protein